LEKRTVVFLATTRRAVEEYLSLGIEAALWVSGGVLGEDEVLRLRKSRSVSIFAKQMAYTDAALIADAIDTIREHHPDEIVWVSA
jgi:hypothetical protein